MKQGNRQIRFLNVFIFVFVYCSLLPLLWMVNYASIQIKLEEKSFLGEFTDHIF